MDEKQDPSDTNAQQCTVCKEWIKSEGRPLRCTKCRRYICLDCFLGGELLTIRNEDGTPGAIMCKECKTVTKEDELREIGIEVIEGEDSIQMIGYDQAEREGQEDRYRRNEDGTPPIDSIEEPESTEEPEPTEEELIDLANNFGIMVIRSHESLDGLFD